MTCPKRWMDYRGTTEECEAVAGALRWVYYKRDGGYQPWNNETETLDNPLPLNEPQQPIQTTGVAFYGPGTDSVHADSVLIELGVFSDALFQESVSYEAVDGNDNALGSGTLNSSVTVAGNRLFVIHFVLAKLSFDDYRATHTVQAVLPNTPPLSLRMDSSFFLW